VAALDALAALAALSAPFKSVLLLHASHQPPKAQQTIVYNSIELQFMAWVGCSSEWRMAVCVCVWGFQSELLLR